MRNAGRTCLIAGAVAAGLSAWVLMRPRYDYVWTAQEPLPESVNIPGMEIYEPNFTPDGKFLIFTRGSAGHGANLHIVAVDAQGMPTGEPLPIPGVTTEFDEIDGMLGTDGVLYFYSDRPGGFGGYDLYGARRNPDGSFGTPENLGPNVNSEYNDYDPCLSPDGKFLYFSSNRHSAGSEEDYDLYVCRRTDSGWSKPRALSGINTDANEWEPMLSRDGRKLYFTSNRPRTDSDGILRTDYDLYVASLTRDEGWGNVVNLGPEVNSPHDEFDPAVNPRNDALLFVRGVRDGEHYEVRIWNAVPRAVPLGPILQLDRVPRTALLALAALVATFLLLWALLAGWRRLSTLQKCLLGSLAAHCFAAWILTMVSLRSRIVEFQQSDSAFSVYTDLPEDLAQDAILSALFRDETEIKVSRAPQPERPSAPDPEPVRMEPPPTLPAPDIAITAPTPEPPTETAAPTALPETPPPPAEELAAQREIAPSPLEPAPQLPTAWQAVATQPFAVTAPTLPAPTLAASPPPMPAADDPPIDQPLAQLKPAEAPGPTVAHPPEAPPEPSPAKPTRGQQTTAGQAVATQPFTATAPALPLPTLAASPLPRPAAENQPIDQPLAQLKPAEAPGPTVAHPPEAPPEPSPAKPARSQPPTAGQAMATLPFTATAPALPLPTLAASPSPMPAADDPPIDQPLAQLKPAEATGPTVAHPPEAQPEPSPATPARRPQPTDALAAAPRFRVELPAPGTAPVQVHTGLSQIDSERTQQEQPVQKLEWKSLVAASETAQPDQGQKTTAPARDVQASAPARPIRPASPAAPIAPPSMPQRAAYRPPALQADPTPSVGVSRRVAPRESVSRIEWGQPENLGTTINKGGETYEPNLSADGRTLFFTHGPAGGEANLYSSELKAGVWTEPKPLTHLNSEYDDIDATITGDGRIIHFYSNRPGGLGGYDLYASVLSEEGEWSTPTNLGARVNSEWNDYDPHISRDGTRLFFSSNRHSLGSEDDYDLYMTEQQEDGSWGEPLRLPINTSFNEWEPALSPDGLSLYFSTNRPGGKGGYDLWISHYRQGQWQSPTPLDGRVNSEYDELDPAVSPDGETLYFVSNRKGSHGTFDIWKVRRRLVE